MRSRTTYHIIVTVSALAAAAAVFIFTFIFAGAHFSPPLLRVTLYWIALALPITAVINIILSPRGKLFDRTDYEAKSFMVELGDAPLKSLEIFLGIYTAGIVGYFFVLKNVLTLSAAEALFFVLPCFAMVLMGGAFLYVIADRLILRFLLKRQLTSFPLDLKEERQKKKNIIIPLFMMIMTFILVFSYPTLISLQAVTGGEVMGPRFLGYLAGRFFPVFAFYLVVVIILMLIWSKSTSLLFRSIMNRLEEINSGKKDLTGRVYLGSIDEIAYISGSVNYFTDTLSKSLGQVKSLYTELYGMQETLFERIGRSADSVREIAENVRTTIRTIEQEDATVGGSKISADTLLANINSVIEKTTQQSENIRESSQLIREMIESLKYTAESTRTVETKTHSLMETFRTGERNVQATIQSVEKVVELSKGLSDVNTIVSSIASQTNLLAMNASIEAAHAGVHGKGFSVVAEEIRSLAENTAANMQRSKENLKNIMDEIENTLSVSQSTGRSFTEMKDSLQDISRAVQEVTATMDEHNEKNTTVLNALNESVAFTDQLQTITESLNSQSDQLMSSFEDLERDSKISLDNARIMEEKNNQVQEVFTLVTEISGETARLNKDLNRILDEFRTE